MLFLASRGLAALPAFLTAHGLSPGAEAVWIPTAANSLKDAARLREQARQDLSRIVTPISLDLDRDNADALSDAKLIVVSGGDPLHLMTRLRAPRVLALLHSAIARGVPYVGISAGAVVAGPSLAPYGNDTAGLGLTPVIVLPHAQARVLQHDAMMASYGARFELLPLRDDQALIVDADRITVVDS